MIKVEETLKYIFDKNKSVKDYPFGPDVIVAKVGNKMFALIVEDQVSLKCEPNIAQMLRQGYKSVIPGYHLNKEHWNTIIFDGDVNFENLCEMIDMSYELVVKSLTKKVRGELGL